MPSANVLALAVSELTFGHVGREHANAIYNRPSGMTSTYVLLGPRLRLRLGFEPADPAGRDVFGSGPVERPDDPLETAPPAR